MEIFTIKVDNATDSKKLRKVLNELSSAVVSLIEDSPDSKKKKQALGKLRERISESQNRVSQGKFLTHAEFKKISGTW